MIGGLLLSGWAFAAPPVAKSGMMLAHEPILPLPSKIEGLSPEKVALGEKLFHDVRLSHDESMSCASCHPIESGGMDGTPVSTGVQGQQGGINAPTVLNSRYNLAQFWDGRARDLQEQAEGPVANPIEMGAKWPDVVKKLSKDQAYVQAFKQLYRQRGLTKETVTDAIATYEMTLITPHAPFDRYLRGEHDAISQEAVDGYRLFKSYGCIACHQGINVGGNMYQTFGLFGNYFQERGSPITEGDFGRFNVTGKEEDRFSFKVPSLRNIALTAPYFHDGSTEDLSSAVQVMAKYQLGRHLTNDQVLKIVAFLQTLTGKQPEVTP
uniref:Cytochrome-c peroxidase n=1 Tax=Magnetococcus massalia (strain MO-1) TaxID=451514 RepID=A0A1S7LIB5_MAGMO|nr:Cytochrome-c peroxidase [Candidatus Magnetococcus massalia]